MKKSVCFLAVVVCLLCLGCMTDVPLSYSTRISNSKILGWWQEDDSTAISIQKTEAGVAQMQTYKYDWDSRTYKPDGTTWTLYFTSLSDSKGTLNFASYGENSEYITVKFRFLSNGNLAFNPLSSKFLKEHNKVVDGDVVFGTSDKFKTFVKNNMRYASLYEEQMEYVKKGSFDNLNIPSGYRPQRVTYSPPPPKILKKDGSYGIYQMRKRKFIRELNRWDDYGEWFKTNEQTCVAKFFSDGGMLLKLSLDDSRYEVFGSNLSYSTTLRSTDGTSNFYCYKGIAKEDGRMLGNITLSILDAQYSDLVNGTKDSFRFDVEIDYVWSNLRDNGFWSSLFNGVEQIHMGFLTNTQ